MSADFDLSTLDQASQPHEPKEHRLAVMWPEELPAYAAPAEADDVIPVATATAIILTCIALGGAAAIVYRDAFVALWR